MGRENAGAGLAPAKNPTRSGVYSTSEPRPTLRLDDSTTHGSAIHQWISLLFVFSTLSTNEATRLFYVTGSVKYGDVGLRVDLLNPFKMGQKKRASTMLFNRFDASAGCQDVFPSLRMTTLYLSLVGEVRHEFVRRRGILASAPSSCS